MNAAPAFQFYADDFFAGTADLSQRDVGAYVRLLCHQWSRGHLPDDPALLRRVAGGPVTGQVLEKFPPGADGRRRNVRMERERQKQEDYRKLQAEKGKNGAGKRWQGDHKKNGRSHRPAIAGEDSTGHDSAIAGRLWPDDSSPSPSPSPEEDIAAATADGSGEKPPEQPKPRKRNPAFDALAQVSGIDLQSMTGAEAGRVGKALSDISRTLPAMGLEELSSEICRRAANYAHNMPPGTTLTPTALAANWGRCATRRAETTEPKTPTWSRRKAIEAKLHDHPGDPHNPANSRKLDTEEFKANHKAFLTLKHELRMLPTE